MEAIQVTMIIPAFNEERALGRMVRDALEDLPKRFSSCEVIIVNDGSRDQTGRVADQLVQAFPNQVKVIHFDGNRGYEAALKAGVQAAQGEQILFTRPSH